MHIVDIFAAGGRSYKKLFYFWFCGHRSFIQDNMYSNEKPGHRALRYGRYSEPHRLYLVTTVTHERQTFFADLFIGRIVVGEMRRAHDEGMVESLAWVLMPDHLHWLLGLTAANRKC